MCTKLANMIWIFLALIVAPIIGCRKAAEVDTSDTKMPVRIVARPPGARDKVSFEIEESDETVALSNGYRKATEADTCQMKIPAPVSSLPTETSDKVSFEIQESDDLASFRQITKGMRVEKVKQILKDFQCVSVGSGFVIDAYILGDQSVVKIWYDKGCVIRVRHNNDKPMIDWGSSFRSNKEQSKGDAAH